MALTDEQKAFAEWLALPKEIREPSTQQEFAEMIGVTPMTLSRWKKRQTLQDYHENTLIVKLRDDLADLYEALKQHAINGKHPRYMEMALQLAMGQFGKKEVDVRITDEQTQAMTTENIADELYKVFKDNGKIGVSKAAFRNAIIKQQAASN